MCSYLFFIQALGRGMVYPRFVWMSYGWYTEGWWKEQLQDTGCSVREMKDALHRSLSFHHFPTPTKDEEDAPTDVNYVC